MWVFVISHKVHVHSHHIPQHPYLNTDTITFPNEVIHTTYMCMHMYNTYKNTCIHTHTHTKHMRTHTRTCTHMHNFDTKHVSALAHQNHTHYSHLYSCTMLAKHGPSHFLSLFLPHPVHYHWVIHTSFTLVCVHNSNTTHLHTSHTHAHITHITHTPSQGGGVHLLRDGVRKADVPWIQRGRGTYPYMEGKPLYGR